MNIMGIEIFHLFILILNNKTVQHAVPFTSFKFLRAMEGFHLRHRHGNMANINIEDHFYCLPVFLADLEGYPVLI